MKRSALIILGFLLVIQLASGQSKVAVLDASLGAGVHPNASAIVADTINEQFVKSADFIALDRAYISSIQEEKKFQLSGDVNSEDIKELGVTFGAKYLCIANVSQLGSTYTVSARLIEVETAQVVSQESARRQGQIDVLFDVAETVGAKLIGKKIANSQSTTAEQVEEKPVGPIKQAPEPVQGRNKKSHKAKARYTLGYMLPGYMGDDGNDTYSGDSYYSFYEMDEYLTDSTMMETAWDDALSSTWGIDFHLLMPIDLIYISMGGSYTAQTLSAEYYDGNNYINYESSWDNFSTIDVTAGLGGIYPVGTGLQLYGGINIGYMVFVLGSGYNGEATVSLWGELAGESAEGVSYGIELGGDFFLKNICISARYKLSMAPDLTGDNTFTDTYEDSGGDTSFGVHGMVLSVGSSF